MIKTYNYAASINFDFDYIAEKYGLSKESSFEECERAADDYIVDLPYCDYYIINNDDEIAQDLYNYLHPHLRNKSGPCRADDGYFHLSDVHKFDSDN